MNGGWPDWRLDDAPGLARYVVPYEVERYLSLPGPSGSSPSRRLSLVYTALAEANIEYSYERMGDHPGWQHIRSPDEVFRLPGLGSCLDLSVTMAGACLVAGLHPMIVVLEPDQETNDEQAHALVLVWLVASDADPPLANGRTWWLGTLQGIEGLLARDLDGPPRPLVAVDPVGFSRAPAGATDPRYQCDLATAIRRGAAMMNDRPGRLGVDVGRGWHKDQAWTPPPVVKLDSLAGRRGQRWVYQGGQGRAHFDRHAHGRRTPAWRRDLFVGRKAAVDRILEHCWETPDPTVPLVVTGSPGSGKSSVLARAVIALEAANMHGAAVHGRDGAVSDIIRGVAAACGLSSTSHDDLIEDLERTHVPRLVVAVDALDEMRTKLDRTDAARLLSDLASIEGLRVVVATRSLASERSADRAWRRSDLVQRLFNGPPRESMLVDLDDDRYFSADELTDLIKTILRTGGRVKTGRPHAARTAYAANPEMLADVAESVRRRAGRNYLIAALIASSLATEEGAKERRHPRLDEPALPYDIGDTLDQVLERLEPDDAHRARGLLTALAYGRGSGLTDARWLQFAAALGFTSVTQVHIDQLRSSPVADFLLENIRKDGRGHTRIFHRALSDHLRSEEGRRQQDESRLCDLLHSDAVESSWADHYVRRFLPSHVLAASRCEEFLNIAEFLTFCYPSSVGPVAYAVSVSRGTEPAAVFRLALPYLSEDTADNADTLELAARTQKAEELVDRVAALASHSLAEITCVEAAPSQVPMNVFLQHSDAINDVAVLEPGLVITASDDGTARVWDPYDADALQLAIFAGHAGPVRAVATMPWRGLQGSVAVTTSDDGTARVWNPHEPRAAQLAIFRGHAGPVRAVATVPWPGIDHPVVVTTSVDGSARVWNPHDPACPELARFDGHGCSVLGVTTLSLPGREQHLIVTTAEDATTRVWDPYLSGSPELTRFDGHRFWSRGVATASWPGVPEPVVVTAGGDSCARVWRAGVSPVEELYVYDAHRARVRNVFTLPWDDVGPAFATCGDDGAVRLWRPVGTGVQTLGTYDAHPGVVNAGVHVHVAGRRPLVVSVCSDARAHVWDPHELVSNSQAMHTGHQDRVRAAVQIARSGDAPLLVTSSNDATARTWEIHSGRATQRAAFTDHTDWVRHVTAVPWPGLPHYAVASGSGDGTIRIWDPMAPQDGALTRFDGHGQPVRSVQSVSVKGAPVTLLLSAGADNTVRLWNPYGRRPEEYAVLRHPGVVRSAIALPMPDQRPVIVAATGNEVHVWEMDLHEAPYTPTRVFRGHNDWVRDLEAILTPHGVRVCSVGNDCALRIWDPFAHDDEHDMGVGHGDWIWGVTAASRPDGPLVITTSADGTLRFWRHTPDEGSGVAEAGRIQLLTTGLSVRCHDDQIVVTTGRGFLMYRLPPATVSPVAPHARSARRGEILPG